MPGMAAMAMGAAPVLGGALLGGAVGQLRGPGLREGIKQDLELLEQLPEVEVTRREALRRSINERIDELVAANDKARRLRVAASSYDGNWRDIVLFACTVLFSIVWWSVDHHRGSWLPVFVPRLRRRWWRPATHSGVCAEARAGCVVARVVVTSRKRRPPGRTRVATQVASVVGGFAPRGSAGPSGNRGLHRPGAPRRLRHARRAGAATRTGALPDGRKQDA
jgi:hypothetical protein